MKPGQLYHVGSIMRELRQTYNEEMRFIRGDQRFRMDVICSGIPARMPDKDSDGPLDDELQIPKKIADRVRRHSDYMCRSSMSLLSIPESVNFSATTLPTASPAAAPSPSLYEPPTPSSSSSGYSSSISVDVSPMSGRRVMTIEVIDDDDDDDDDEKKENRPQFCSTPMKPQSILRRPAFDAGTTLPKPKPTNQNQEEQPVIHMRPKKGQPLTPAQVNEAVSRRRKRKIFAEDLEIEQNQLLTEAPIKGKKRKSAPQSSSDRPSSRVSRKKDPPAPAAPAEQLAATDPQNSAESKIVKSSIVVNERGRKRMKFSHDLTMDNLTKVSNIRRKLFADISLITAPVADRTQALSKYA